MPTQIENWSNGGQVNHNGAEERPPLHVKGIEEPIGILRTWLHKG